MKNLATSLIAAAGTGTPVSSSAWDLAYFHPSGDPPEVWDVGNSTYTRLFSVSSQDTTPTGVWFKPDGRKMYVAGSTGEDVIQYDLTTAWNVSTASYVAEYDVSAQTTSISGLVFSPDGTKLIISGSDNDAAYAYALSTAWDISTTTYTNDSYSFVTANSINSNPNDIYISSDGYKLYNCEYTNNRVFEFDFSTAWDLTTLSYNQNYDIGSRESGSTGLSFKEDGTKMYVLGFGSDAVNQFALSTAWDVSTASYEKNYSVLSQNSTATGLHFRPDGGAFYVTDNSADKVTQYAVGEALISVSSQGTTRTGIHFKSDGTQMYISESSTKRIYPYNLSTAWDITTATYTSASVLLDSGESGLSGLFFKPDGTAVYQIGTSTDAVKEWTLSTAWDLSTSSAGDTLSVSSQESIPQDLFFHPDGTKLYVIGSSGDDVNEYSLTTAWDLTTASYYQNFSVSGQTSSPYALFFKSDGTKMYVGSGNKLWEYELSVAWDVSTASYSKELPLSGDGPSSVTGFFFSSDGEKLYILSGNYVYQYGI